MNRRVRNRFYIMVVFAALALTSVAQTVPMGINYQAVARDNSGKEIANQIIQVRFSILSGNTEGEVTYQEVHANIRTTAFGVFSLIVGKGERTGGTAEGLAGIPWENANHFLKVEVDFGQGFINMGTMQFFAVPYALYAHKSLEPGPQGPKGDQGLKGDKGDPATDNQKLSFDGSNLTISPNGNTVNLSTLNIPHSLSILGDTLSIYGGNKVGLPNQIQDLTLDANNILKITKNTAASSIDLSKFLDNKDQQTLGFNTGTNILSILNGNTVDLTPMKQDLNLTGNSLTITNKLSPTLIDLSKYLQTLSFNSTTNKLSISNVAGDVDLTSLKNDADSDPTNEIQSLSFDKSTGNLTISSGNTISINNMIGFKAKKTVSQSGLTIGTTYPFVNSEVEFNEGSFYDSGAGSFTAPITGIYTFFVSYKADGSGSSRVLSILKNGTIYEVIGPDISSGAELSKWVTMKLNQGEYVSLTINTGMSQYSGTGSFVGYRVN
jgi:hypothetical protein